MWQVAPTLIDMTSTTRRLDDTHHTSSKLLYRTEFSTTLQRLKSRWTTAERVKINQDRNYESGVSLAGSHDRSMEEDLGRVHSISLLEQRDIRRNAEKVVAPSASDEFSRNRFCLVNLVFHVM